MLSGAAPLTIAQEVTVRIKFHRAIAVLALLAVAIGVIISEDANSAFQSPIATPEAWTQETPVIGTPACDGPLPTPTSMELVKPAVPAQDDDDYEPIIIPKSTVNPLEGIRSLPVTGS